MIDNTNATTEFTHNGKKVCMPYAAYVEYEHHLHFGDPKDAQAIIDAHQPELS